MLYNLALYVLLGVGLAASVGFLVLHHPRHPFRITEVNSSGWVIIIGLIYARSVVLLGSTGSIGTQALVDWDARDVRLFAQA